jgi:hypothetical protein
LCFSKIPLDQNYRIYVHEDGSWNVKGRFKDALEDDEEVSWVTDNGHLTLAVCAEGRDSFAAPPPSYVPVSQVIGKQGDLSKNELIALLNIPEHLSKPIKNAGLRINFSKYRACLQAQDTLNQKIRDGSWPQGVKKPTSTMIIEVFVSRSYWHTYMTPAFHDISHYPLLKEWLEDLEGGPSDADVWGVVQTSYGFSDLQKEKERRQQSKGKGKPAKKDNVKKDNVKKDNMKKDNVKKDSEKETKKRGRK